MPELLPVYDEHIRDNNELLPYVFMGDVARFFVAECGRVVVGQSQTEFFITRFLAVLENELMAQEEETTALITLGFCENIAGETSAIGILKQNMGPFLAAEAKPFL